MALGSVKEEEEEEEEGGGHMDSMEVQDEWLG
jgi:hypothetical protein